MIAHATELRFFYASKMRLFDWIANPTELVAMVLFGLPTQNYDNFTRASARWKLKIYDNYGNFFPLP